MSYFSFDTESEWKSGWISRAFIDGDSVILGSEGDGYETSGTWSSGWLDPEDLNPDSSVVSVDIPSGCDAKCRVYDKADSHDIYLTDGTQTLDWYEIGGATDIKIKIYLYGDGTVTPRLTYLDLTTTPHTILNYWNGSEWELKRLKVWDGSAWVDGRMTGQTSDGLWKNYFS
ncbi:hypothetical protein [Halonotius roseus]|uniref:Uncharacterized protein n=1 Tax=Halonotius roseus TaxID=2511997 RepID=A0A544QQX6_9EURY|nr:hypothetical protein [Halonotius roseus]TQQ81840.1 hypothetical protein EWF95_02580 [Halonotius roseus]